MKRRLALAGGASAALFGVLGGCSKQEPEPVAAPAAPVPANSSRQAYEVASGGTGFVVGQPMAARNVLVFFDPQCPHCATLWLAAKPLHDRIRMVWMPVAFIADSSAPQGAMMLSAPDPVATMDEHERRLGAGQGGLAVSGPADPQLLARIKANTDLWQSLNADAVPYLIYRIAAEGPYGMQSGGMPTAQLAQLLEL